MVNQSLLFLLESVLGKSKETANNNHAFECPFCKLERAKLGKSKKNKLEINLLTNLKGENLWACWFCHQKGKTIRSLFKKLKVSQDKLDEIKKYIKPTFLNYQEKSELIELPKEFIPLSSNSNNIFFKRAINYLKNRGINNFDISRYNIGYCSEGLYSERIIIPSYGENYNLNYFIARSFEVNPLQKYKNPKTSRDLIFNEFFINWDLPIIICEGVFNAITIKRNVILLLGKTFSESLMKKIVTSQVKKVYIALDSDALKTALKHCEELMKRGKEVYLVELKDKDASEIGFEKFTNIIQNVKPLTFSDLITKKIELC